MRHLASLCIACAFLGVTSITLAQDAGEKSVVTCDKADAKNKCGGAPADCLCADDTFEVVFDGKTQSVLEVDFKADLDITTTNMTETKADKVQGWSYGVDHDDAFLTLQSVTVDGTDAEIAKNGGFVVADMNGIQTCKNDPDPKCKNPAAGHGYISAIILSFVNPVVLAVKRNSMATAKYKLKADPKTAGTEIAFVDYLKKTGSPPADINITIDGKSKTPAIVIVGIVKSKTQGGGETNCTNKVDDDGDGKTDCDDTDCVADPACVPKTEICDNKTDDDGDGKVDCDDTDCATSPACKKEICNNNTDDDGDGKVDCQDTDCATDPACPPPACEDYAYYFGPAATATNLDAGAGPFVITMRNKAIALGFQLGAKATTAGATTTWEFAGTLGTDANRLIELVITDDKGDSQAAKGGNKATSSVKDVSKIERGAAITGFSARDFFASDLAPGVGGPGFTVGYVADTNPPQGGGQKIPATGATAPCPVNEILKVTLGGAPPTKFSRGDADGNGKINVSDGVLIIQIIVGNITAKFACQDILDANDDGKLNVADALPVLNYVFLKGPNLPAPFRTCDVDPTAENPALTCTQSNCQ